MSRIVVVDDSKLMRDLIRRFLEQAGHTVETWEDVTAGEIPARITAADPDLVITDYQMPGCNGLTVARMARKAKAGLPVMVVTATHDPEVLTALTRQEIRHILHKPFREQDLVQAVAGIL